MSLDLFTAMEVSASGLSAERVRMNALASNLANARTTRTAEGGPYKRLDPVFTALPLNARSADPLMRHIETVQLSEVRPDASPGTMVWEPGHPDANSEGYVEYP